MRVDQSFSLILLMSDFEIQNRKEFSKFPGNVPVLSLLKDYPQLLRGRPGNFVFMIYILYSIFCLFHFYLFISRGRPGNHFSFISFFAR